MMRIVALVIALSVVFSGVAFAAAGGEVQILGSYVDPITGDRYEFVNAKSNDSIRQNQSVIYVMHTAVEKVDGRWKPVSHMVARDAAYGDGFWNNFGKGGAAGLFQAGGMIGLGSLLRPSTNSNNNYNGDGSGAVGNGNGSLGAGAGGSIVNNAFGGVANAKTGPVYNAFNPTNTNIFKPTNTNFFKPTNTFTETYKNWGSMHH